MRLPLWALITAALLCAAAPAFATQARVEAMGGGVKLWTVEDTVNIYDFPSLLVRWGNRVYLDNLRVDGEFPAARFGFHYHLGDDTVLAIFGANLDATGQDDRVASMANAHAPTGNVFTGFNALGVATQALRQGDSGFDGNVDYRFGAMFATVFGTSTRFGISVNIMGANDDQEQPAGQLRDLGGLLLDFGLGLGLDLDGSELEMSVGLEVGFGEDLGDDGTGGLQDANTFGHLGVRVGGRWTFDFFNQTKIVAYTQFLYGSQSVESAVVGVPNTSTFTGIQFILGADLRIEPFADVLVSPGLGVRISNYSVETAFDVPEDTHQRISVPFYGVAVDLKVADWLDVRFGAQQSVDLVVRGATDQAGITIEENDTEVTTTFDMGLGVNVPVSESTLSLDLHLSNDFLLNGPYLATGNTTDGFVVTGAMEYAW